MFSLYDSVLRHTAVPHELSNSSRTNLHIPTVAAALDCSGVYALLEPFSSRFALGYACSGMAAVRAWYRYSA